MVTPLLRLTVCIVGNLPDEVETLLAGVPLRLAGAFDRGEGLIEANVEALAADPLEALPECDLAVIALSDAGLHSYLARQTDLSRRARGLLLLVEGAASLPPSWPLRAGCDAVMIQPVAMRAFARRVEVLLHAGRRLAGVGLLEEDLLRFVDHCRAQGITRVVPSLDPFEPAGYTYPEVDAVFGHGVDARDLVERLTAIGMVRRQLVNRLRVCPSCASPLLNHRQCCPKCSSLDFTSESIIHHFPCGNMDVLESYRRGGKLVCAKCEVQLLQIGLDYEKPTATSRCASCHYIFAEPKVESQCFDCLRVSPPEQTVEVSVFAFTLTDRAAQATATRRITSVDLAALLKDQQTGFTKQYLSHELARELMRFHRHGTPTSLLMVRVNNLNAIQLRQPERTAGYVAEIFAAISAELRPLDVSAAWGPDLLAVLLPQTGLDGAQTVADRLVGRCQGLEHVLDLAEPNLSVSAVTCETDDVRPEDLVESALELLDVPFGDG